MATSIKQKLAVVATGAALVTASVVALRTGSSSSEIIVTNQSELYNAFRQAETSDVTCISLGVPVLTVDSGMRMSGNIYTRSKNLIIDLKGGSIVANSDTIRAILYRRPKTQDEALNVLQSQSITLMNGAIIGSKGKSIGFEYCCGYGGGAKNVRFYSLSEATHYRFSMMTKTEGCIAVNCTKYGFVLDNGDWVGAGYTNAQSNSSIVENCRVFCSDGMIASFATFGASGVVFRDDITEGGKPKFHILHDALGSTVVKDITIQNVHIEAPCDSSGIKLKMFGGIATIDKVYCQYAMTLIDVEDFVSYPHVHVNNIPWMLPATRFKTSGNNIVFDIDDVIAVPVMTDTSRWVKGVKPYYMTVKNYGQALNITSTGGFKINGTSY